MNRCGSQGISHGRWPDAFPAVVAEDVLPSQPALPRVKVLHVITRFWAGAGGNTLLSAVGMDRNRYEVWVAGAEGGPLWERAGAAGLETVQLPRFREVIAPVDDARVLIRLVLLMRRERFTIVHTHSSKAGFIGRVAARLVGVPVVVHTYHGFSHHDFMSRRRRKAYIGLERIVRPLTDAFLAVAPRVAIEAVELRLAPPGCIEVVPSAVELDEVPSGSDPDLRGELGIPEGVPVVGTVGRIDFQKAPLDFVRMASSVSKVRADAWFVMVGDGPLLQAAEAEAHRLGVRILFTGQRADAVRVASTFDVFVICSLYEGLGRALTEALASARPVVASAVNGVPDLIQPGKTGLLAPPSDPDALARSVIWMLEHPHEAALMGVAGRDAVREYFDADTMCRLIDAVYCEQLGIPCRPMPGTS